MLALRDATAPVAAQVSTPRPSEALGPAVVEVVRDRSVFDAIAADWLTLESISERPSVFQSLAWCRAVWNHHERHGHRFEPIIFTVRERGRLIAVLPLKRVRSGLAHILTGFGEPYQQYTDVLIAPDASPDTTERLLDAACAYAESGGLSLLKVRDDSPLAGALAKRGATRSNADAAPFVDLAPFPDFKAYHATIKAKTRKNIRNARNRLARGGNLEHRVLTDPAEIDTLVARAHAGRERWLDALGLTSRAFRDASFGDFTRAIAAPESGVSVMAMSLTLDGRPVADQWGVVLNDRYYAYVATWAPEFEESSPGKLHLEEVIRACHDRGLKVADFLMPAVPYKFTWAHEAMPVADYTLPLSLRARLSITLWSGHLRPALKRVALMLPPALRSRAARLLLRR